MIHGNPAATVAIANNMRSSSRRSSGGGGGGLPPDEPRENQEIQLTEDKTAWFLLEPFLTSGSGYAFWHLYIRKTKKKYMFFGPEVNYWSYINDYASQESALESARHLLKNAKVVEIKK